MPGRRSFLRRALGVAAGLVVAPFVPAAGPRLATLGVDVQAMGFSAELGVWEVGRGMQRYGDALYFPEEFTPKGMEPAEARLRSIFGQRHPYFAGDFPTREALAAAPLTDDQWATCNALSLVRVGGPSNDPCDPWPEPA